MGMIRSSITVVEEGQVSAADDGDSGNLIPVPAGVTIPTAPLAVAEMTADARYQTGVYQTVKTTLRDDGIDPAVLVLQRGIPTVWTITNDSQEPENSRLIFPIYYTQMDIEQGDNGVQLLPVEDFDFSTAGNVFYGYVKVVDDLDDVDIQAIKAEVSEYEPFIYPDAYFEASGRGASCCAR
jgi:hypothetical protein